MARRVLQAVPTLFGVIVLNFALLHLIPGDLADALAADLPSADAAYKAALRVELGLDKPILEQFVLYVWSVLHFDFGYSYLFSMPVIDVIGNRAGATMLLMLSSIFLSFVVSVAAGVYAARKVRSVWDTLITVAALVFYATPVFWIGLMLIVLFAIELHWLPVGGFESVGTSLSTSARMLDILRHLLMPMITLSLFFLAVYTRLMRASMLEVYGLDFVRTARAKGLTERLIAYRHIVPNALLPVVTMLGLQIGAALGGAVVVETVFSWPGIGRLAFDAVFRRDYHLLLAILFFSALFVIVVNILIDLLYARLDPRIELR
jgi:peptide/nickel transport system permease protein